ncbi:MAG: hypothetical protein ACE5JU_08245 [Candidatus Binatia bacterium]
MDLREEAKGWIEDVEKGLKSSVEEGARRAANYLGKIEGANGWPFYYFYEVTPIAAPTAGWGSEIHVEAPILSNDNVSPVKKGLDAPSGGKRVYKFRYCYTENELKVMNETVSLWLDEVIRKAPKVEPKRVEPTIGY